MIKGWKNNPEWIKYYEEKQKERNRRIIENYKLEWQARQMQIEMENKKSFYGLIHD